MFHFLFQVNFFCDNCLAKVVGEEMKNVSEGAQIFGERCKHDNHNLSTETFLILSLHTPQKSAINEKFFFCFFIRYHFVFLSNYQAQEDFVNALYTVRPMPLHDADHHTKAVMPNSAQCFSLPPFLTPHITSLHTKQQTPEGKTYFTGHGQRVWDLKKHLKKEAKASKK